MCLHTRLVGVEDVAQSAREDSLNLVDLVAGREEVDSRGTHDGETSANLCVCVCVYIYIYTHTYIYI